MKYRAVEDILPREQDETKDILNQYSLAISNAIDFGTHIMNWDIKKQAIGDDNIVPPLFLRNILDISDSISILVKNSSIDQSKILLRSLLENIFCLEYLIEKNTKNRALSFLVWSAHQDLNLYKKFDKKSTEGKQFRSKFKKDRLVNDLSEIGKIDYKPYQQNSEELLNLTNYIDVEKEYQATCKNIKNPAWYSLFSGPKNIEQLAFYLKRNVIYEVMYRGYSGSVHATNIYKGKLSPNKKGTVDIIQIRNPIDAQSVTQAVINYLIIGYQEYIKHRLPERKNEFKEWYFEFKPIFDDLQKEENKINFI